MDAQTSTVEDEFVGTHMASDELFRRQAKVVPGGVTHMARAFEPFPLFISALSGAHKQDVDGHDYVDYWMAHGANLLGHRHPAVHEAIQRQLERGLHACGENETAVALAEAVCRMVPSASRVRFCASGGEATQLAIRLARAYSGHERIIKFEHHFHGWHDAVAFGFPPSDTPWSSGLPDALQSLTVVLPFNDADALSRYLSEDAQVAGVLLEPGGAHSDTVPVDPAFLRTVRELCTEHGVVLVFDEVVTGFRYARGGAQEFFGVTPDVTALGKIMGGGLPIGAVAGGADIMEVLAPRRGDEVRPYVPQYGTWNGMPIAAAAGLAALRVVETSDVIQATVRRTDQLRAALNGVLRQRGVEGTAYGRSSIWKTYLGEPLKLLDGDYTRAREDGIRLASSSGPRARVLRQSMILDGVDVMYGGGFMSAAHDDADLERTVTAFDRALTRLQEAGLV